MNTKPLLAGRRDPPARFSAVDTHGSDSASCGLGSDCTATPEGNIYSLYDPSAPQAYYRLSLSLSMGLGGSGGALAEILADAGTSRALSAMATDQRLSASCGFGRRRMCVSHGVTCHSRLTVSGRSWPRGPVAVHRALSCPPLLSMHWARSGTPCRSRTQTRR